MHMENESTASLGFTSPSGLLHQDLALKSWIRTVKFISRSLDLACSTVVIGLSITAFVLFTTTKDLEPIAGFNPWAEPTTLWPQILILIVACISFIASAIVIVGYLRHGHRGAESISYVTTIAMVFGWAVWLAIWIAAGASLQRVRATGNRRDLWGWACAKHTPRYQVFHSKVDYDLMCRIQEWNFICSMINIGAWVASVSVMLFTAYRLWVRNKMGPQTEKQGVSVDA